MGSLRDYICLHQQQSHHCLISIKIKKQQRHSLLFDYNQFEFQIKGREYYFWKKLLSVQNFIKGFYKQIEDIMYFKNENSELYEFEEIGQILKIINSIKDDQPATMDILEESNLNNML